MTDHQRATVLKAQNEALTEKQMDFTQYVPYHMQVVNSVAIDTDISAKWKMTRCAILLPALMSTLPMSRN